ncbi:MAG: aminopeptidase P family protein, partial [Gemmatimonadota bacterium]
MPVTDMCVSLTRERLYEIQDHLERQNLDGWLLYDFRGSNAIATGLLGLPSLSRRFVVYLPAVGEPIAVTHRIEQQPWRGWIGGKRVYLGWESFEDELRRVLNGAGRIALEYSPDDAVPYLDRVPGGIVDLVRSTGV